MLDDNVIEFLPSGSLTSRVGDSFLAFLVAWCLAGLVNGGGVGAMLGGLVLIWCGIVISLLVFLEMIVGAEGVVNFGTGLGFA